MSELVRSVGLLGTQRVVLLVLGAVRTKIAASLLGPAGMGILGQAMALRELLSALSTLGTRSGYLKLVAECHGREDMKGLERLIVTTVTLVTVLALTTAAAASLASSQIAAWAFGDPTQGILVVLVAITVAVAIPGKMLARTFTGVLDYRTFLLIAVVESVMAVFSMAALATYWGVAGAVASFAVIEAVVLVLAAWLVWRRLARPLGISLRPRRPDSEVARRLLRLAGALTITSLTAAGVGVFVRAEILRQLGTEANGYYQVAWQVGQNYLGLLGTALWSYGMPKVATRLEDPAAILHLQNNFLRIVLTVLAPGVLALLATRELWIPILFTPAFLAASTIVAWQLVGELVAMVRQSMNISLLPRERLRFLVFQALLYWGLWAGLSTVTMPYLGASAAAASYFAANLLALVVTYVYHHRALDYRVQGENRRLLLWMVPGVALGVGLTMQDDLWVGRVLPLLLSLAWLWTNRGMLERLRARDL
ncbi:MAG: oligosaccharide flippase family protein [Candidatus Binatia bacterium]|nr:oligosaccharide flippase family protein [Candidatus Binatia bacterium]